jgi:hypothetical protein
MLVPLEAFLSPMLSNILPLPGCIRMLVPMEALLLLARNKLLLTCSRSPLLGAVRMMESFPPLVFSSLMLSNILPFPDRI